MEGVIVFEEKIKYDVLNMMSYDFVYQDGNPTFKAVNINDKIDITDVDYKRITRPVHIINHKGKQLRIVIENNILEDLVAGLEKDNLLLYKSMDNLTIHLNKIQNKYNRLRSNWFIKILFKLKIFKEK